MRIIEKETEFHLGQRGPGIQPRSLELLKFLGMLPGVMNNSIALPPRVSYEMPGGVNAKAIFHMTGPPREATPAIPYVGDCRITTELSLILIQNVIVCLQFARVR